MSTKPRPIPQTQLTALEKIRAGELVVGCGSWKVLQALKRRRLATKIKGRWFITGPAYAVLVATYDTP